MSLLPVAVAEERLAAVETIGMWHLADRWWNPTRHPNRLYYRVMLADFYVFELFHDTRSGAWVLDVVYH